MRRLYFVGGHGVGKTTLSKLVSERFGLRLLSETARTLLAETDSSLAIIRNDIGSVTRFQRAVFERQVLLERDVHSDFVSDRACDNLAYLCEHGESLHELAHSEACREYVEQVRGGLVFFVRPLPFVTADGTRPPSDLQLSSVHRIDGMVKLLLELFGIPYFPVDGYSLKDRWTLVEGVVRLYLQVHPGTPPKSEMR